ncbi:MAG: membrane protein insertion efficiency factor YidD [Methylophilaceae bacterium]
MSNFFVFLIKLYQWCLSPFVGPSCRFEPSCSSYAIQAISKHGVLRGLYLAVFRLGRCHPWCKGGHDPVP